jgi:hypothetical protein
MYKYIVAKHKKYGKGMSTMYGRWTNKTGTLNI